MSNNDGHVIIDIDSNAAKVTRDFDQLGKMTDKYERVLQRVEGTANSSLPVYDKIRTKLKEQQNTINANILSYQKLANAQKSGIGYNQLNSVTTAATDRLRNLALQGKQNSVEFQKLAQTVRNAQMQMSSANNIVNKATGFKELGSSILNLNNVLAGFSIGYISTRLAELGKSAVNTSMDFQALENRMNAAAGNKSVGADSLSYIRKEADRLGLSFKGTADSFAGFEAAALRSGLTLGQTKQIFSDISTAATSMQLPATNVELTFKALEQIAGKGTVSMEELRQQLGDHLPGAFEIAAKSMGMTTREFYNMVSEGKVLSSEFLPAFASALKEELGGSALDASTQLRADLNRLNTAMFDLGNTAGSILTPATQKLVQNLTQATIATQSFVNYFSSASVKVSMAYSDETNKIASQLQEYSKLLNSKKLTINETNKLKAIITELSSKYPTYIGQITQELKLNGQLSDTTSGLIRAEIERTSAISVMTEELNKAIQKEELLYKARQKTAILMSGPFFQHRQRQINIQRYEAEANAYDESTKSIRKLIETRKDVEKRLKNLNNNNSNYSLGASTSNLGGSSDDSKKSEKVKGPYAQLNEAAAKAKEMLNDLAAQGITSGKVWDNQVQKVNKLTNALDKVKQATDLNVLPPFQALNAEIQTAQEKVNNLAAAKIVNLDDLNLAKEELTKLQNKAEEVKSAAITSPFQAKQNALSRIQSQYLDLAIQGQGNSRAAIQLKNLAIQYQNQINKAQASLQNSVGLSWSNISSTISSSLSQAITTPLQQGENALERFGNVALNTIQAIAQQMISSGLSKLFQEGAQNGGLLSNILGGNQGTMTGAAAPISAVSDELKNILAQAPQAAASIASIGTSQTAALTAMSGTSGVIASAMGGYASAATAAGQLAASLTQAAIAQAAYSAALVPIAGAVLAPVAATATGAAIGTANILASAGMLASRVTAFADGGIVDKPTYFPMKGNRMGLMGEAGTEAIMPLRRTPDGRLGVEAQVQQPNITIYNQSGASVETVQRPDGDTEIFIRKVNNALRNERTQSGFSSALQRNNSRGVQAS